MTAGRRRTLIVAVVVDEASRAASGYWAAAEAAHRAVLADARAVAGADGWSAESKLHWIFSEFLEVARKRARARRSPRGTFPL